MLVKNTQQRYGLISILLHWLSVPLIIGLFALGLWMTSLGYYHPWYKQAPQIHKSLGVLFAFLLIVRLIWRLGNTRPADEPGLRPLESRAAHLVHWLLYVLLFGIITTGYLLSTSDGRSIDVFNLFSLPALPGTEYTRELAERLHKPLAVVLISLAALHALAALKHHFINKDATLKKILGLKKETP